MELSSRLRALQEFIQWMQTERRMAVNLHTKPTDLRCESADNGSYRPHPPLPFITITEPESCYSFHRPMEGMRLSAGQQLAQCFVFFSVFWRCCRLRDGNDFDSRRKPVPALPNSPRPEYFTDPAVLGKRPIKWGGQSRSLLCRLNTLLDTWPTSNR